MGLGEEASTGNILDWQVTSMWSGECGPLLEYRDVLETLAALAGLPEKQHIAHCGKENPKKVMRGERRLLW